jgi:hypothetical protein
MKDCPLQHILPQKELDTTVLHKKEVKKSKGVALVRGKKDNKASITNNTIHAIHVEPCKAV